MNRPPTSDLPPLLSFPARPVNGGRLEDAPPKIGPWVYQPKIKDWRAVVHVPTQRIWNRQGEPMSISADLAPALIILADCPFEWLDVGVLDRQNQLLRGSIVVFDFIRPISVHSYRRKVLKDAFDLMPDGAILHLLKPSQLRHRVFLIPEWLNEDAVGMFDALRRMNRILGGDPDDQHDTKNLYEGLVAKRTDKPYPIQLLSPDKTTPWMMKHRFDQ